MALRSLYQRHFDHPTGQRLFLSALGFTVAFPAARAFAYAARKKVGPFRNVSTGGTHIHHSFWGIFSLLAVGYAWLLGLGSGNRGSRRGMRVMALLYGAGAALTLDEYALWLKLQDDYKIREDDYWQGGGRKSIYAVVMFGSLLLSSFVALRLLRTRSRHHGDQDSVD